MCQRPDRLRLLTRSVTKLLGIEQTSTPNRELASTTITGVQVEAVGEVLE